MAQYFERIGEGAEPDEPLFTFGPDLGRRGRPGQAMPVLLDEPGHQAAVEELRAELRHSGTVERHDATPDEGRTDLPAGGGSSGVADSLVGPQCLTAATYATSENCAPPR
jgi:hypothetical protein